MRHFRIEIIQKGLNARYVVLKLGVLLRQIVDCLRSARRHFHLLVQLVDKRDDFRPLLVQFGLHHLDSPLSELFVQCRQLELTS